MTFAHMDQQQGGAIHQTVDGSSKIFACDFYGVVSFGTEQCQCKSGRAEPQINKRKQKTQRE